MISFKVGYNFDDALLAEFAWLNDAWGSDRRIGELFGSLPSVNPVGTARPAFRLKDGDENMLADHVGAAAKLGIEFNYTLNVSMVDPRVLKDRLDEVDAFLSFLQDIGVARITFAHPLVGKVLSERCELPLEISTISQVRDARQLHLYKERFPRIDKLCVDVFLNRDWEKLQELADCGREVGVRLELLVNEFCVHQCIDRNVCYDIHSLDLADDERRLFNNYPMGNCISLRIRNPAEWLRARFVLPQWVGTYRDEFGIDSFKISGRTHASSYVAWVTKQYMKGEYGGNLLELWADVENIGRAHDEYRQPRVSLDVSRMPAGFLDFYRSDGSDDTGHVTRAMEAMIA